MKKIVLITLLLGSIIVNSHAQDAPNVANSSPQSASAQEAAKLNNVSVNIFSGMPIVAVPLYQYGGGGNGLSWGVSLSYYSGGNQLLAPTPDLGLGWSLSATTAVTRVVKGMPDDLPNGFMYTAALGTDIRNDAEKYYYDTLDAQQDVFQFSVPGASGSFVIGKDKQLIISPLSKIKITYTAQNGTSGIITAFKIITEDGIKYEFPIVETTSLANLTNTQTGYANTVYNSAWYLDKAIAPFNTDTIKFNYAQSYKTDTVNYPQTIIARVSDGVTTSSFAPTGSVTSAVVRLTSIAFPDKKTVSFVYEKAYTNAVDSPLVQVNISDTTLRYGYKLGYKTGQWGTNEYGMTVWKNVRILLTDVTPYTPTGTKKGYKFIYANPTLAPVSETSLQLGNQRDHWGFYNGAVQNGNNMIPQVNGVAGGANRNPNYSFTLANILSSYYVPDGGYTFYEYEPNDHYPYIKDPNTLAIQANTNSQNTISLNQVFSSKHQLLFSYDNTVSRVPITPPFSGTGTLQCSLKSTDGTITYATMTVSLYDLYYQGIKNWVVNAINGSYRLETQLLGSTNFSATLPINVTWENKLTDITTNANVAGGLRIKRLTRTAVSDDPGTNIEEYRYVTEDGKSSGFLGDIPKYDYAYSTTVINGVTTITPYTVVNSEPVGVVNYAQGSPVGYSRVEVIKGSATNNIGKTVYEFTDLKDVNSASLTPSFPYAPIDMRSWGIGLPKKVLIYDKNNLLIKKTVNQYGIDTLSYINANNKSIKLGKSSTTYYGDPNNSSTYKVRTYTGQEFYPSSGRVYLTNTKDTLYQPNGSISTTYKNITYDANYNVKTVVSSYDRTRNLQVEKRLYYPYDYTIGGAIGTLRTNDIISPVISSESWIIGDANPRMLGGSITDYQSTSAGYIKPLTIYATESNAPIPQASVGVFNAAQLNRNTTYFKPQQSFTLYDVKGNLLQTQSPITGRKSATMMDYQNRYPIAQISNAGYNDFAYTSFEAEGTGNWTVPTTNRNKTDAITGTQSYNLQDGFINLNNPNNTVPYTLTFWAKTPSVVYVNMVTASDPIATQNGWALYKFDYSAISSIMISGGGLIDEVRFFPKDANMVTTTYNAGLGLATSSADANNTIVYSEYDTLNRIKLIRDKDKNIVTRYDYEADPPSGNVNVKPHWVPYSQVCHSGNTGGYDSLYIDDNPQSPSYNQTQIVSTGINYCTCTTPGSYPQYKTINGICELGVKIITSSVYQKICDINNVCVWKWVCTYHYEWSDGSVSPNYTQYSNASCPLGPDNS